MRPLPSGPIFERADARALGWSDSAISRAIRAGRLVAVRHGQLCAAQTEAVPCADDHVAHYQARRQALLLRSRAAARSRPGSVLSHHSAAALHGLAILNVPPAAPALTVAPRAADGTVDAHVHRATLTPDDIVQQGDIPVTSVARTIVDLGRAGSIAAAVVTVDDALHRRLTTPEDIDAVLQRCWNWPGIRRATRAVALADARAESPLESVSRLLLRSLDGPIVDLQRDIYAGGTFIGRVDFYWDEFGVVGEADGAGKYLLSSTSLLEEKYRQEQLEELGLVVVRWGWSDTRQAYRLRARIRRAWDRGHQRDRSGFHREWSLEPVRSDHFRWKPDR